MKTVHVYEVQFTTTSHHYKAKLLPWLDRTKQVLAENQSQAIDHAYQKLMADFPKSEKSIWDVKQVIKKQDNVLQHATLRDKAYQSLQSMACVYFKR